MNSLTRQDCDNIDKLFDSLKKRPTDSNIATKIGMIISKATGKNVKVTVVDLSPNNEYESFLMSIAPDESTVMRISKAIMNGDSSGLIKSAWEGCQNWTIEIDKRIITDKSCDFTPRELTALIMHETQHMLYSSTTRRRILNVFRMCYVKQSIGMQNILRHNNFADFTSPIMNNLFNVKVSIPGNGKELRKELDADKFAAKMGYRDELNHVIEKLLFYNEANDPRYVSIATDPKYRETEQMFAFTADTVRQLTKRKDALARRNYAGLSSPSIRIQESLDSVLEKHLPEVSGQNAIGSKFYETVHDTLDEIIQDTLTSDFFYEGVFDRKLKRVDPYDLSYIDIQISSAKTDEDRILINAFLHSKLDLVEYYLTLFDRDDNVDKIPHTKEELIEMRSRLKSAEKALIHKETKLKPFSVLDRYHKLPDGYEG